MFLDEGRLSARLNHPNIVQTNEVGSDGQQYFLEMEYLEGQSLEAIVRAGRKGKKIPPALGIWILTQVLAGLHYAHESTDVHGTPLNIVHRDVSPHNIFVTYDGIVKVLDFGIAKASDVLQETASGVIKGKAKYMAPEQALRRNVDRRADIFAVGVIFWQLLTGERIWGECTEVEIFMRLERGEIDPPRKVNPDVPEELELICMKALAVNPDERYATAEELQVALEDYLEKQSDRAGQKQLAKLVNELFAARRAAVRAEIATQMSASSRSPGSMPMLGASAAYQSTISGISRTKSVGVGAGGAERELDVTKRAPQDVPPPPLRKKFRPWTLAAAALVVLAGAFALQTRVVRPSTKDTTAALGACLTDLDCTKRRAGTVCGSEGVCVARAEGCLTNRECVQARNGASAICRKIDHTCVALASDDCKLSSEPNDIENDDVFLIGSMWALTGPDSKIYGVPSAQAVELARRDFSQTTRGIPTSNPGAKARPIAVVTCDGNVDSNRVAHFLADDLRVPAVIGFVSNKDAVDLCKGVFNPAGTICMAASNRTPLLASLPNQAGQPRMVWRETENFADSAHALAAFISGVLEKKIRASSAVSPGEPIKVAVVRFGLPMALGFVDEFYNVARFNDKSALENGSNYASFDYGDPFGPNVKDTTSEVVRSILEMKPHVVLYIAAGADFGSYFLNAIEVKWPPGTKYRPIYVTPDDFGELYDFVGKNKELRGRMFGEAARVATLNNGKFILHYNETFADKVTLGFAPSGAYDAFYLLAYSASLIGSAPITGVELARGMSKLVPPGRPFDVGPSRILDSFAALRQDGHINYNGAAGPLDFNLETGEAQVDNAILCMGIDASGAVKESIESGMVFNAATQKLEGALHCP